MYGLANLVPSFFYNGLFQGMAFWALLFCASALAIYCLAWWFSRGK